MPRFARRADGFPGPKFRGIFGIKRRVFVILKEITGGMALIWFWRFVCCGFLGFLLEVAYARVTGGRQDRKGLLLLPLCPVYGVGALGILWLAPLAGGHPAGIFVLGAAAATAAEYALAAWYEQVLGVQFWDYRDLPGNLHGRVCLPFSLAWGVLSLGLVYWVDPMLAGYLRAIPAPVTLSMALLVGADLLVSSVMMRRTGGRDCLRWYRSAGE